MTGMQLRQHSRPEARRNYHPVSSEDAAILEAKLADADLLEGLGNGLLPPLEMLNDLLQFVVVERLLRDGGRSDW